MLNSVWLLRKQEVARFEYVTSRHFTSCSSGTSCSKHSDSVARPVCPLQRIPEGHKPVERPRLNCPFIILFFSFCNLPEKEANLHVELI